jgi:hypothetical protein
MKADWTIAKDVGLNSTVVPTVTEEQLKTLEEVVEQVKKYDAYGPDSHQYSRGRRELSRWVFDDINDLIKAYRHLLSVNSSEKV